MVNYDSLMQIEQNIVDFNNAHPMVIIILLMLIVVAIVLAYRKDSKDEQARIRQEREEIRAYIKERNRRIYKGF